MPSSHEVTSVINFAMSAFVLTGVAVTACRLVGHNSIPWEAKKPLARKYGKWAVNMAEGFCPQNDVACVEREAKRFLEVRLQRRKR